MFLAGLVEETEGLVFVIETDTDNGLLLGRHYFAL
jgi:hypothetical protein